MKHKVTIPKKYAYLLGDPWSDFIREVGSGGGSIVSTHRPTNS